MFIDAHVGVGGYKRGPPTCFSKNLLIKLKFLQLQGPPTLNFCKNIKYPFFPWILNPCAYVRMFQIFQVAKKKKITKT